MEDGSRLLHQPGEAEGDEGECAEEGGGGGGGGGGEGAVPERCSEGEAAGAPPEGGERGAGRELEPVISAGVGPGERNGDDCGEAGGEGGEREWVEPVGGELAEQDAARFAADGEHAEGDAEGEPFEFLQRVGRSRAEEAEDERTGGGGENPEELPESRAVAKNDDGADGGYDRRKTGDGADGGAGGQAGAAEHQSADGEQGTADEQRDDPVAALQRLEFAAFGPEEGEEDECCDGGAERDSEGDRDLGSEDAADRQSGAEQKDGGDHLHVRGEASHASECVFYSRQRAVLRKGGPGQPPCRLRRDQSVSRHECSE